MKRVSEKVKKEAASFAAVYREVDQRSEGRCEVCVDLIRCARRGVEHHHLFKPRRSHHTAAQVLYACRSCHDRMEWPYWRGRLCYVGSQIAPITSQRFFFVIRYAADKFSARGQGHA